MNNKGVTIVEILLSIIIMSIVLIILFSMLSNVRNEDEKNQIKSQYVVNQSLIVQAIEEDIINYGVKSVEECSLYNVDLSSNNINQKYRNDFKCLRINYASDYLTDNIGFLMIYNYYNNYDPVKNYEGSESSWMTRYVRGHYDGTEVKDNWRTLTTASNNLPDQVDLSGEITVKYTNMALSSNNSNAVLINIPIKNPNGDHYDINLSFLYTTTFTCSGDKINCIEK